MAAHDGHAGGAVRGRAPCHGNPDVRCKQWQAVVTCYSGHGSSTYVVGIRGGYRRHACVQVVFERGPIRAIPEQWANRRSMFEELDTLQPGWTVELRARGSAAAGAVDAVFFDPAGDHVGAFAAARRKALQAGKAALA